MAAYILYHLLNPNQLKPKVGSVIGTAVIFGAFILGI
jgi:hypothetical protein